MLRTKIKSHGSEGENKVKFYLSESLYCSSTYNNYLS